MQKQLSPAVIAGIIGLIVVAIGAVAFFSFGGSLGGGKPTEAQIGVGGGDVKPGELPEGVKYHDLGGSAGPGSSSEPPTKSSSGP